MLKNGSEYAYIYFLIILSFWILKNDGMQKISIAQVEVSKKKVQFSLESDVEKLDKKFTEFCKVAQETRELLGKLDTPGVEEKAYADQIKKYRDCLCIAAGDQETLLSFALDSWASKGAFFTSRLVSSSEFAYGNNIHKAIKNAYGTKISSGSINLIVDYREIEEIIIKQIAAKQALEKKIGLSEKEIQTIEENEIISQSFSQESQTEIKILENISVEKKRSWPYHHPFLFASGAVYIVLFFIGLTVPQ